MYPPHQVGLRTLIRPTRSLYIEGGRSHLNHSLTRKFDISRIVGEVRSLLPGGQKKCEFGGVSREEENRAFGASLSLFRALDWEIEVFQVSLLSNAACCQKLLPSRSCWKGSKIWDAELVWRVISVLV